MNQRRYVVQTERNVQTVNTLREVFCIVKRSSGDVYVDDRVSELHRHRYAEQDRIAIKH
jgi:hypothetical protein